jgi:hypothetical protein
VSVGVSRIDQQDRRIAGEKWDIPLEAAGRLVGSPKRIAGILPAPCAEAGTPLYKAQMLAKHGGERDGDVASTSVRTLP